MKTKNLKIALETLRDTIIEEAKANLINAGKGGGALEDSLQGTKVTKTKGGFGFDILMEDYGEFVDKGVSGVEKKYNTPYSYRDKMPPPSKLDKWIVKKSIAPRDEKGRFLKRKTVQFLIARSIFKNGIAPSLFYTNAYKKAVNTFSDKLEDSVKKDVQDFIKMMKKNIKK